MKLIKPNQTKLAILNNVLLQSGIAQRDFSLEGYSEDRVCLEYEKGLWHVYVAERGQKCDLYTNKDFSFAVQNLITKVSYTPEQAEKMIDTYSARCRVHAILPKNLSSDTVSITTPIIHDGKYLTIKGIIKETIPEDKPTSVYVGREVKPLRFVVEKGKRREINHEKETEFEK